MAKKQASGKKPKKKAAGKATVTMYDVGFGDCFLLRLPTSDGEKRMLFDCGSIKAGSSSMDTVVKAVIADVTDSDGVARIDVVVATHRHKDHVSGFASAAWDDVEVREVWMPWTEHPTDPKARDIRNRMHGLALHLSALAAAGSVTGVLPAAAVAEIALNALSNESAMRTLHHGFSGNPKRRFYAGHETATSVHTITPDVLPGATVYILGPSKNPDVIKDMDPPVGKSYLRLVDPLTGERRQPPSPFDAGWTIPEDDYAGEFAALAIDEHDRTTLKASAEGLDGIAAAALDKAVNGTSLMMVLQFGKLSLLFPGDAQWGTWKMALENADARELLGEAAFIKLGHHGSHNASPTEFVEKVLQKNAWVMVSTRKVDQWPNIPRRPLIEALEERTDRLARSDQPAAVPLSWFSSGVGKTTAELSIT
jgi:beta-lactamase superfamily II metal-dependent hydrolase